MDKLKPTNGKGKPVRPAPSGKLPPPGPVAPLFRRIDWIVFGIAFLVMWAIYLLTLAPELTLEDSGELCTGSYYAGIPHPPGYPFWSIYSWLWTVILPIGNVAWRVEVGESFGIAMGCGLLALMVSRGSSMLMEGIEELRDITRRWENAICMVSGFVAGMVLGLDGFIWSEADVINRISVFGVPWLILVLLMLMRWMYAPHQWRYLYLAMLFYGICATIHQTLLLSAMGVEVAIACAQPRLGRDLFLSNSIIYLVGLYLLKTHAIPAMNNMSGIEKELFHIVGIGSLIAGGWMSIKTGGLFSEWKPVVFMGILWCLGVAFYLYEPISGMMVPPMQWGYPRTVEGFFHALSRGQYDTTTGYDPFTDPLRFFHQLQYLVQGLGESYNWVFMFIGLMPFLFLLKMHKRERSWIIGLSSIYICLAVLLVILLNVGQDRSSQDLNKVFFTASHALFSMMIGYGLTLMAAYMATHYAKFRRWAILSVFIGINVAFYCLADAAAKLYIGPIGDPSHFTWPFIAIVCVAVAVIPFIIILVQKEQEATGIVLTAISAIMGLVIHPAPRTRTAATEIARIGLFMTSSQGDLFQALLGPLLDFRRELPGRDELLQRLDRLGLADLDQEVDERDLNERIALGGQGLDQALADAGPVAEQVQGVDRGQADIGIGVGIDGLEERVERRGVGVLDGRAVADALEPVGSGGLAEQGQGHLLAHVLDLPRQAGIVGAAAAAAAEEPAGPESDEEQERGEGGREGRAAEAEPIRPAEPRRGRRRRGQVRFVVLEHGVEAAANGARGRLLGQDAELGPGQGQVLQVLAAGGAAGDMRLHVGAAGLVEVPGQIIGESFLDLFAGHDTSPP